MINPLLTVINNIDGGTDLRSVMEVGDVQTLKDF